ncbi:MAG: N-acetylneuraminate synthase family protein [Syntrophotaleaceae bacterium]
MEQIPLFIAEVSSNHNRSLERCLRFIDQAAEAGCSGVKFQLFRLEELFAPEILSKSALHRKRKEWELPGAFLPALAERCRERKVLFSSTPFYLEAVQELFPYVDFYKIASYELLWSELLVACAATGKPVVLSTGMATMEEIERAVATLRNAGCEDLTLLHCVSGYPAPIAECNLAAIETLSKTFNCEVGWSDHSVSPGIIYRAVHRWGARMVEFHLDLDGEGEEFSTGHCWLPEQIGQVIDTVGFGLSGDGTGDKEPTAVETPDRQWRADPGDGLRPLKKIRGDWHG